MPRTAEEIAAELAVLREIAARERRVSGVRESLRSACHPRQRAFVEAPGRNVVAVCARQGGKSYGAGTRLIDGALDAPGSLSLYIAITRQEAVTVIVPTLLELDRTHNLQGIWRSEDLEYILPNGSKIAVRGCPDRSHVRPFRGPKYRRCVIDEAWFFGDYLHELVDEVLSPATAYWQGSVDMITSPGAIDVGLVPEILDGKQDGWTICEPWTMRDNPYMPPGELEHVLHRRKWTPDHPTFRREYLGERVHDPSMLVYSGYSSACDVASMPTGCWRYVLGVDFGAAEDDPTTAYVLTAYSDSQPVAYLVEAETEAGATTSSIARRIGVFSKSVDLEAIVGDAGALGIGYIRELRERYGIPIEPAEKEGKRGYIELMNGDLKTGMLRVVAGACQEWISQARRLPWSDKTKTKERRKVPNHVLDAGLYAWRRCKGYLAIATGSRHAMTREERMAELEKELEEAHDREADEANKATWWQRARQYGR